MISSLGNAQDNPPAELEKTMIEAKDVKPPGDAGRVDPLVGRLPLAVFERLQKFSSTKEIYQFVDLDVLELIGYAKRLEDVLRNCGLPSHMINGEANYSSAKPASDCEHVQSFIDMNGGFVGCLKCGRAS